MPVNFVPANRVPSEEMEAGVSDINPVLRLNLDDKDIINSFRKRLTSSREYWDGTKQLKARRERMENYWMGKHDIGDLYDFQTPYLENRIHMHVEHIVQATNTNLAAIEVRPAKENQESRQAAFDFQQFMSDWVDVKRIKDLFEVGTRQHLLSFFGAIKIRWNPMAGPLDQESGRPIGDVEAMIVRPHRLVIDKHAVPGGNPSFVAELLIEPLEEVLRKFPNKKSAILDSVGLRGVRSQMSATVKYWEVHFTFLEDGFPQEGVVWLSEQMDMVFEKMKSPFWDTEGVEKDGRTIYKNLLERPTKPYAFFYNSDLAKDFVDETNAIEQALPLQDVINKRGRQIVDAAADARGGWIFSTDGISKENAAQFANNPDDHLIVKGDIRRTVDRKPSRILEDFVFNQLVDARNQMDDIIGLHAPSRGQRQGSDQPTTIQLLKEGDFERLSGLVAGIERAAEQTYRFIAHTMKMNYEVKHWEYFAGERGRNIHRALHEDDLSDGMEIRVKTGTTLPTDKISMREEAMELMKLQKIDYVTFFERLGFPNPKEQARTLWLHETDPKQLYKEGSLEEDLDEDLAQLREGKTPAPPDEVRPEYLAGLVSFLRSEDFQELDEVAQETASVYVEGIAQQARQQVEKDQQVSTVAGAQEGAGLQGGDEIPAPQAQNLGPQGGERMGGDRALTGGETPQ